MWNLRGQAKELVLGKALKPRCFIWSERGEPRSTLYVLREGGLDARTAVICIEPNKWKDARRSILGLRGRQGRF